MRIMSILAEYSRKIREQSCNFMKTKIKMRNVGNIIKNKEILHLLKSASNYQ